MRRGKPLAQIGRRAMRERVQRDEMRVAVLDETKGRCCAKGILPGVCWGGTEVHEVIDRSVRPGVHLDPAFGISICHAHHLVISDDASLAREVGLSFYSHEVVEARERAAQLRRGL